MCSLFFSFTFMSCFYNSTLNIFRFFRRFSSVFQNPTTQSTYARIPSSSSITQCCFMLFLHAFTTQSNIRLKGRGLKTQHCFKPLGDKNLDFSPHVCCSCADFNTCLGFLYCHPDFIQFVCVRALSICLPF